MTEQEGESIKITHDDVRRANQLSEGCPICGSPVERVAAEPSLAAVSCGECETLYHRACWEQVGVCAMIGCESNEYVVYGEVDHEPILTLDQSDIRAATPFSRNQQLKAREKQRGDLLPSEKPVGLLRRIFNLIFSRGRDW